MSKKVNVAELASIVAQETNIDQAKVEKFIQMGFITIESTLLSTSAIKIDNLGAFKVLKGGFTTPNKILFLPDTNPLAYTFRLPHGDDSVPVMGRLEEPEEDVVEESVVEERQVAASEQVIDAPQVSQHEKGTEDNNKHAEVAERKGNLKKITVLTVIAAIILVAVYFVFFSKAGDASEKENPYFEQITNTDTANYLGIVETLADGNLLRISYEYYGSEDYWVYIYEKNKEVVNDPPHVSKGTVIRIPKMDAALVDPGNKESLHIAENRAREILSAK